MYIEELLRDSLQIEQQRLNNFSYVLPPATDAYASFYPQWEVTTPQYQSPSGYTLAQLGYRTNELVFTCINVRADSVAEASISLSKMASEGDEEIEQHGIYELLEDPCPNISQQTFWKVVETYLGIAGFSAWEKQRNNFGEVVGLWPMRPDWCSFLRGQQKPIRAIRYQPHGMPHLDIAIEDIVLFQYFDPLYPLLKPYSPTMAALNMVQVDNATTLMLNKFIENGAFLGGILSTENQVLQETEAEVYKRRWQQAHGGANKAGEIAVIGKGLKFQTTNNTFRDMVFPEVDARSEARICMTFRVPPMLIGAKIGVDRSTYTNYPEARKGFYEGPISAEWKFLSGVLKDQLVPDFENDKKQFTVEFDTSEVKALQEDTDSRHTRAREDFKTGLVTRDEAREMIDLDPVDEGELVFHTGKTPGEEEPEPVDPMDLLNKQNEDTVEGSEVSPMLEDKRTQEEKDLEEAEEKKYRSFAKRRIKEAKYDDLKEYEFKYLPEDKQNKLIIEYEAQVIIAQLRNELNKGQ